MSLYRQLWLAVLASFILALGLNLYFCLNEVRTVLEEQQTARDLEAATDLARRLAASPALKWPELAASFYDDGRYVSLSVLGATGRVLFERTDPRPHTGAPSWFVRLIPLHPGAGHASVDATGPVASAVIKLSGRGDAAYRALWRITLGALGATALASLLWSLLGSLVFRRLLRPVRAVVEQARAINEHRFITIPLPAVPELRQLAGAMNDTVLRLKAQFEAAASRNEAYHRGAVRDERTGLANRGFFLAALDDALEPERGSGGHLAIVRIADLGGINRRHGRPATDGLLREIARILDGIGHPGALPGRLNGAEFALLLPPDAESSALFAQCWSGLDALVRPLAARGASNLQLGHATFSAGETQGSLLARVDAALARSESLGGMQSAAAGVGPALPGNGEQWRALLQAGISEEGRLKLLGFPLRVGADLHWECPLSLCLEGGKHWIAAGSFLPIAERLELIHEFDLAALSMGLDVLEQSPEIPGIWLHLSGLSLEHAEFRRVLLEWLRARVSSASRLWLQIPESSALQHLVSLRDLVVELKPLGCRIGLSHFGQGFEHIDALHGMGLDFIKVDAAFVRQVDSRAASRSFLAGLRELTRQIGMGLFAEGVETEAEQITLLGLGCDGLTGRAIQDVAVQSPTGELSEWSLPAGKSRKGSAH